MNLTQLISNLPIDLPYHDNTVNITDICDDSRLCTPGCLFIARSGSETNGSAFIDSAIQAGAVAVLCQAIPKDAPQDITWLTADKIDNKITGQLAETFFDHPSRKLRLVGITGTNGKTTTAYLTRRLLRRSGVMCGMIGTIEIDDGINRSPASLTTPGCIELSRLLANMVNNGCTAGVIEVSSHALDQDRISALNFHVGIFTNLTGDHLDYHGNMENYAQAKAKLFQTLGPTDWAILNIDDPYSKQMTANCKARILSCRVTDESDNQLKIQTDENAETFCTATILEMTSASSRARLNGSWGSYELRLPFIGKHNLYNTLQALAAANTITAVARKIRATLEQPKGIPGRLEKVTVDNDLSLPTVLVDYAHTQDALKNVLSTVAPLCKGKLICVFGCGGDRDVTKRPKMAKIACQYSDTVIITSDNPRTQDPQKILTDIQAGIPSDTTCTVQVIEDRQHAIAKAIELASPNDTVLIAGKGHEDYQIVGTQKLPFDDRKIAATYLAKHVSRASC